MATNMDNNNDPNVNPHDLPDDMDQLATILTRKLEEKYKIRGQIETLTWLFDKQSRAKNDISKSHNDLIDGFVEVQDVQQKIGEQLTVVKNNIDKVKPAEEPEQLGEPEEPQISDEQKKLNEACEALEVKIAKLREWLTNEDDEETYRRKIEEKQGSIADLKAEYEVLSKQEGDPSSSLAVSDDDSSDLPDLFERFFKNATSPSNTDH